MHDLGPFWVDTNTHDAVRELGPDELLQVFLSLGDATVLCRISMVCMLWRTVAETPVLWKNLAAQHWLGPIQSRLKDHRIMVTLLESELSRTRRGECQSMAVAFEQGGLHVLRDGHVTTLCAAPFRVTIALSPRSLCCVAVHASLHKTTFSEAQAGEPLVSLRPFLQSRQILAANQELEMTSVWNASDAINNGLMISDEHSVTWCWEEPDFEQHGLQVCTHTVAYVKNSFSGEW
eukprot:CAMPEP_0119328350 /NCGR_PEP_ID=MMETSP1333-20130426/73109_1 /TAXON_ID=418940 /ORGANISM="Scyphosphaera apsteinii, Strain RCC1455" /LENGTH=233 /DNA_ID=CAMNT_0007337175 /DNA_START=34 /DNA_END=732 /DNA_ORIENTATION=-